MSDRKVLSNPDIPAEAIVRQLIEENKKLKEDVRFYKGKVNAQNNAIQAFKKWQRDVTERTIEQWLREAIRLDEPLMSKETYERIKSFIGVVSQAKQALSRQKSLFKAIERFTEDEDIMNLLNNGEQNV